MTAFGMVARRSKNGGTIFSEDVGVIIKEIKEKDQYE
jgi:hypothetical protein